MMDVEFSFAEWQRDIGIGYKNNSTVEHIPKQPLVKFTRGGCL